MDDLSRPRRPTGRAAESLRRRTAPAHVDGVVGAAERLDGRARRERWLRAALLPVEHTHRAQRVPVAGLAFALVHAEVEIAQSGTDHLALVRVLERPAPVRIALGPDEADGLGHPRIGRHAGI